MFNKKKKDDKKFKNKLSWAEFWDIYREQLIYKNSSQNKIERNYNLYGDMTSIMSGRDKIGYLYVVKGYPDQLDIAFRTSLRRACKPGVRINFFTKLERDSINWSDPKIKRQTEIWDSIEKNQKPKNIGRNSEVFESGQNKAKIKRTESLMYLYNATRDRGRKLFLVRGSFYICGERGQDFDTSIIDIEKEAKAIGLEIERVSSDLPNYLRTISPLSMRIQKGVLDKLTNISIPDEIVSRFNTYDQGTVGQGSMILGLSIRGQNLVLYEPKANPTDAVNILIAGETGSGKSYKVKFYLYQFIARDDMNATVNDLEGHEYNGIAEFVANRDKVIRVNLASGNGQYLDPVPIHLTGNPKLDEGMFSISKSFTLSILKTYASAKIIEKREWAIPIIKASLDKFYEDLGVLEEDPETWTATESKTQFDIYPYILKYTPKGFIGIQNYLSECKKHNEPVNDEFLRDRDLLKEQLNLYLGEKARVSSRYSSPVSISDLQDAKLVIVSFGMQGRSESTVDAIDMGLMQIYAAQISYLRSIFSLNNNKFNVKVWEEMQRWGDFPDSDEILKVALSGGRKLGDINLLVINRLKEIVETDRFGILESIQSFSIGAINDAEVRAKLCKRLSIEHMASELDLIYRAKSQESKGEEYVERDYETIISKPYSRAFVEGIDGAEFITSKVILPKSISNTQLFQTGVDVSKKDK